VTLLVLQNKRVVEALGSFAESGALGLVTQAAKVLGVTKGRLLRMLRAGGAEGGTRKRAAGGVSVSQPRPSLTPPPHRKKPQKAGARPRPKRRLPPSDSPGSKNGRAPLRGA
jgi:hypothetical protein